MIIIQHVHYSSPTSALPRPQLKHWSAHNKTNYIILTKIKGEVQSVGDVIANMATNLNYIAGYTCRDFIDR